MRIYVSAKHLANGTKETNPVELAITCKFQGWMQIETVKALGPLVVVETKRGDLMVDLMGENARAELKKWQNGQPALPFWIEVNYVT